MCVVFYLLKGLDLAPSHQYFSVKLFPNMGAESFSKEQKVPNWLQRVAVSFSSLYCYTPFSP